jgi:hypothetical protein
MLAFLLSFAFCLLLIPSWVRGQTLSIRTYGVSNTQALLAYQPPPDTPPCTVEVWEGAAVPAAGENRALVHDVDPQLFPGENLDDRPTHAQFYGWRVVVIGQRRADKAADGKLYSRALQAYTPHAARITCGDTQILHSFTTATVPTGENHPENPPFHAEGFGNYGWPSIHWPNRDKTYIDPLTGVELKRLTKAGEWGSRVRRNFASGQAIANPAWSFPDNAVTPNSTAVSSTTIANAPLFLALRPDTWPPAQLGGFLPNVGPDDIALRLTGNGIGAPADRTVLVCLSVDSGQTCRTNALPVVLPSSAAAELPLVPSSFPSPLYGGWGGSQVRQQHWPRTGRVSVAAGAVTLTQNLFNQGVPNSQWDTASAFSLRQQPLHDRGGPRRLSPDARGEFHARRIRLPVRELWLSHREVERQRHGVAARGLRIRLVGRIHHALYRQLRPVQRQDGHHERG